MTRSSALIFQAHGQVITRLGRSLWDVAGCSSTPGGDAGSPASPIVALFSPPIGKKHMYDEERREVQELSLTFPRLSKKEYNSMALLIPHTSSNVRSTPSSRTTVVVTAYVVLVWFLLVLSGSVLGIFAQSPLVFYLTVGAPVVLFLAGYLLSEVFRGFVRYLVGDPWVITALQTYRVLGVSMAIEALWNALPTVFGLPAGFGDLFIGVTALLAAASWSSGGRFGKGVFALWNVLGLLDLIIAVSTGVLAGFTSSGPVTMAPMRFYPLSLVPAFGVPLAFILHFTGLAQFWYLSRKEAASHESPHLQQHRATSDRSV